MKLIIRFLFGVLGLWLACLIVPGVSYATLGSLVIAAIILGVVNAIIRPILIVLTLPLTIITLGLFLLVINALMLWLTAAFLSGFHVNGFVSALLGSIVVSIVVWIGHMITGDMRRTRA